MEIKNISEKLFFILINSITFKLYLNHHAIPRWLLGYDNYIMWYLYHINKTKTIKVI